MSDDRTAAELYRDGEEPRVEVWCGTHGHNSLIWI